MPKISLITLCYNQLENATKPFLESLEKHTAFDDVELIIVNNASTDGTKEFLEEYSKNKNYVTLINNDKNLGFAVGNNQGLKIAKGDYIFLLNNDLLFTPDWLNKFVEILEKNEDIGLISCLTNYSGQKFQLYPNANKLTKDNYVDMVKLGNEPKVSHEYLSRIIFFCVGITRKAFEKVGFLDENFGLAWYEDDDYTLRILDNGFKTAIAQNIFIFHNHSQTTGKIAKTKEAREMEKRNKAYFEKKHIAFISTVAHETEAFKNRFKKYKKLFNILLPIVIGELFIIIILIILLVGER